ncbi:MAG: glucan 1,4-alpha-glucosidase [Oceanospirillaceae bacterium]|nr:glucan 1,4-alpha-glucosidase [Oceanospirillaceae bacterium]
MKPVSFRKTVLSLVVAVLAGHQAAIAAPTAEIAIAPGAPGQAPYWSYSGKTGIGTAYEQYQSDGSQGQGPNAGPKSKVWFSLARGVVTETMYGMIHEAQLRELQLVVQGRDFTDLESEDTDSETYYLSVDSEGRPDSLAYKVINRDREGLYEIEKHIFTNPDTDALMMRIIFRSEDPTIQAYVHLDSAVGNDGSGDSAFVDGAALYAQEAGTTLVLKASEPLENATVGFVGVSDGLTDLLANGRLDNIYNSTGSEPGNVALLARLPRAGSSTTVDLVVGFGADRSAADKAADRTLARGYTRVLSRYNGEGAALGWQDYLQSLSALPGMYAQTTDNGKLLNVSAMVLKAQEDKLHPGALIASLSNPWGDTTSAEQGVTGYKAVWPRDFYQCAMALLALGDRVTPKVAFEYLKQVQVRDDTPGNTGVTGWFLQKTHVDGELEWMGVQLDQTAMPIMLGWKLWQAGILNDAEIATWYREMLEPAADFLVSGGQVKLGWNDWYIMPPFTQQERWEEQFGYSPSTTAALIAGLVAASDIAAHSGDMEGADVYLAAAKSYSDRVESSMFTQSGELGDGRYYLRITQNDNPNDGGYLGWSNGQPGLPESQVLDAGFLELVRYGVRAPTDSHILDSLGEIDSQSLPEHLKLKYNFSFDGVEGTFPGWRRYGNDGYGENQATGDNWMTGDQSADRGRVWPFFTGERGHFELALAKAQLPYGVEQLSEATLAQLRNTYVKSMELFANEGLMLPEQVWDGVGDNSTHQFVKGEGTNSATPLSWTHAEYVKLVRSLSDQAVWDRYPIVPQMLSE